MNKSETLTFWKESSPLSIVMLDFTAVEEETLLVRSQTGDLGNLQEVAGVSKDLRGMKMPEEMQRFSCQQGVKTG
jgi:hypothetical protein